MSSSNFNLRNPQIKKIEKKETPINLVIRWDGKILVYPTKLRIHPNNWDQKKQITTKDSKAHTKDYMNDMLSTLSADVRYVFSDYLKKMEQLTVQKFKDELDQRLNRTTVNEMSSDLFGFIDDLIELKRSGINKKTGERFHKRTIYKYTELRNELFAFESNLDFNDLTVKKYNDFVKHLEVKNLAKNTVGKYIKVFRAVLNSARQHGIKFPDTYIDNFHTMTEESSSIYFTEQELTQLFNHNFDNAPKLDRVRDLFLIGCWTGLRFADFVDVTRDKIDGDFLEVKTQKNRDIVVIPINETVTAILQKYDYLLPEPISNQKFNTYLKDVCRLAKLDATFTKKITKGGIKQITKGKKYEFASSHVARRSFATNLYKQGFPTISIMAITGHKTERAFLAYIKVTPREHAELLKEHWREIKELRELKLKDAA
ncbi:MAG: site-specific recombinase XerD [Bacteroidia bacterium]|jgi:site-specific recombinase XerD